MSTVLKKIQNGHKEELELLIYHTYPKIYSYIFRKLGNETVAKDLTQETFLRFMKRIEELPGDTKVLNYLYRVSYHLCMDYYRIYQREVEEMEVSSEDTSPMDLLIQKESKEQIQFALNQLSEDQKDVILLKYYQDLKIKEIAEILNEKESTIKTRLRLGTRKLKSILRKEDMYETKKGIERMEDTRSE